MATQPLASTPPALTDNNPGFFETLPRELRDQIYDSLYDSLYEELDDNLGGVRCQTYTICTEPRLVSRQFKLEYDERTSVDEQSKQLTVIIPLSHFCWCKHKVVMLSRRVAAQIAHMTVIMVACDGVHTFEEFPMNCDKGAVGCSRLYAKHLLHYLPHLRSFHFKLHKSSLPCALGLLRSLDVLIELPKLTELKIMSPQPTECLTDQTDHPAHIAIWTEQDGLQQDQEAIELCRQREMESA